MLILTPAEVFCSSLVDPVDGAIAYSPDTMEPFDFRTVAFHSCDVGYYLQGNELRTCTGDGLSVVGNWDGFIPICSGTSHDYWLCSIRFGQASFLLMCCSSFT